jgi:hypothetical protein
MPTRIRAPAACYQHPRWEGAGERAGLAQPVPQGACAAAAGRGSRGRGAPQRPWPGPAPARAWGGPPAARAAPRAAPLRAARSRCKPSWCLPRGVCRAPWSERRGGGGVRRASMRRAQPWGRALAHGAPAAGCQPTRTQPSQAKRHPTTGYVTSRRAGTPLLRALAASVGPGRPARGWDGGQEGGTARAACSLRQAPKGGRCPLGALAARPVPCRGGGDSLAHWQCKSRVAPRPRADATERGRQSVGQHAGRRAGRGAAGRAAAPPKVGRGPHDLPAAAPGAAEQEGRATVAGAGDRTTGGEQQRSGLRGAGAFGEGGGGGKWGRGPVRRLGARRPPRSARMRKAWGWGTEAARRSPRRRGSEGRRRQTTENRGVQGAARGGRGGARYASGVQVGALAAARWCGGGRHRPKKGGAVVLQGTGRGAARALGAECQRGRRGAPAARPRGAARRGPGVVRAGGRQGRGSLGRKGIGVSRRRSSRRGAQAACAARCLAAGRAERRQGRARAVRAVRTESTAPQRS